MNQITFTPTQADYVEASKANYLYQLRTWKGCARLFAVVVIVIVLVVAFDFWSTGVIDPFWPAWLIFVLVMVPIGIVTNLLLLPRRIRRQFAQQPGYAEPMSVRWSNTGFEIDSPMTTHRLEWRRLVRWRETRDNLLLYVTQTGCLFVPKRIFEPDTLADFRSRLVTRSE